MTALRPGRCQCGAFKCHRHAEEEENHNKQCCVCKVQCVLRGFELHGAFIITGGLSCDSYLERSTGMPKAEYDHLDGGFLPKLGENGGRTNVDFKM